MTESINVTVNLSTCVCSVCGVVYTLPCNFREKRLDDHETFFCPNGHRQCFPGESTEEELEKENIELQEENIKLEASLKYYKNKANKVKK